MSVVMVMLMSLVALLTAGTADAIAVFAARQKAIVAAESAALAAADAATWLNDSDPVSEARAVTEANGAQLIACDCEEGASSATVTVRVDPDVRLVEAWIDRAVTVSRTAVCDEWVPTWAP